MTETSTHLNMPYMMAAQAQKHVTHNEALRVLDAVVQLSVTNADQTSPPASVEDGDRYVVAPPGSGEWAGQDGAIATYNQGMWQFILPQTGWRAYDRGAAHDIVFDGTNWTAISVNEIGSLGINADADAYNRFVVSSDAVLFDHDGNGHQIKVNKAANGDTASLLFQTNYAGRAELGTTGTDDFAIKVSQDGTTWFNALAINGASGAVSMPHTPVKEVLTADRTFYVDVAAGDDTNAGLTAAAAFETIDAALAAMRRTDAAGHVLTVQLADGTYTVASAIDLHYSLGNTRRVVFSGNTANPENVVLTGPGVIIQAKQCEVEVRDLTLENTSNSDATFLIEAFGTGIVDNVVFGPAAAHIDMTNSTLRCSTKYTISGDCDYHIRMLQCATLDLDFSTITLLNTPDFTGAFIRIQGCSYAEIRAVTFVGAATGRRYQIYHNSAVQTINSGETYLPGNVNGIASQGGRYS